MEEIQAAIERLNAAEDIDEEELERLEAEIDALLAAAGLPGLDDSTAVDANEEEDDAEVDGAAAAAAAAEKDVDRRASSQVRLGAPCMERCQKKCTPLCSFFRPCCARKRQV